MHSVARGCVAAVGLSALALTTASCGTALINNEFSATVVDPSRRLPAGPVEISIFDSSMGQSDEWARKSMGTTSPGNPYTTSFKTTTTKFIGDNGPSQQVTAGVAIPAYQAKGFFQFQLTPADGQTVTLQAPFIGYYDYNAATDGPVKPLPMTITAKSGDLSWQLSVVIAVPPK